jgi:hypothetical protein
MHKKCPQNFYEKSYLFNSKHLHYLSEFYTFVYITESFPLQIIFEYAISSAVEKYVHWIQTQFVLNDTI